MLDSKKKGIKIRVPEACVIIKKHVLDFYPGLLGWYSNKLQPKRVIRLLYGAFGLVVQRITIYIGRQK